MGGRGASSSNSSIYNNLVNKQSVINELTRSVTAQKYENPNAKIGDTIIDSDRIISNYADTLTTQEYSKFNTEVAERKLFSKLKQIEKSAGFKK